MAISYNSNVPLSLTETMGSVMTSMIDAQAHTARATMDFINDIGFNENGSLNTVSYQYQQQNDQGENTNQTATIPLLGMIDIPSVTIDSAKIKFSYDITQSENREIDIETGSVFSRETKISTFKGKVSRKFESSTESKESANLTVEVNLAKGSVPVGLERLLDILEQSITDEESTP